MSQPVLFGQVKQIGVLGIGPDIPVLASLDWRAAVLAVAALIAMLRLKLGMLPTLGACAFGGLVLGSLVA
jgi:chromate transporter